MNKILTKIKLMSNHNKTLEITAMSNMLVKNIFLKNKISIVMTHKTKLSQTNINNIKNRMEEKTILILENKKFLIKNMLSTRKNTIESLNKKNLPPNNNDKVISL